MKRRRTTMTEPEPTTLIPLTDWEFRRADEDAWQHVRLPHDAMIGEARSPRSRAGADLGWFPGGSYVYRTIWRPQAGVGGHAFLRFEGVQGDAVLSCNGHRVGTVRSGYTEFELPLADVVRWDRDNELVVEVDNSAQPASRWYSGSGLYRAVSIVVRPYDHFAVD